MFALIRSSFLCTCSDITSLTSPNVVDVIQLSHFDTTRLTHVTCEIGSFVLLVAISLHFTIDLKALKIGFQLVELVIGKGVSLAAACHPCLFPHFQ